GTTSLLKKYGLKSMTMDEIAFHLRVFKKAIYHHFTSKDALLVECLMLMNAELEDLIAGVELGEPRVSAKIIAVYNVTVEYLSQFDSTYYFDVKKKPQLMNMIRSQIDSYKLKTVRPLLQQAKNEKLLAPEIDVDEAVDFFMKFILHFYTEFKGN